MIETVSPATNPQVELIKALVSERPNYHQHLAGQAAETVHDVLGNVGNPDPKFVSLREARAAIRALLTVAKPGAAAQRSGLRQAASKFTALQEQLRKLHVGHYALPRRADGVLDFFEVVERDGKNGRPGARYVNRLLGSPGDWRREHLSVDLQAAAARAISGDWVAAAKLYADHFQTCARCDAPLSNTRSRAAKIGHDCAKIWGWKW